jgi:hypothetical protein
MPTVSARALKVTLTIDPAVMLAITAPESGPARTTLTVRLPDRSVAVDLASKSVRKAQAAIRQHGPEAVAVMIQGKLVANPDRIAEAGLVAQPKKRPEAAAPVAEGGLLKSEEAAA